jgi:hypothetical protein
MTVLADPPSLKLGLSPTTTLASAEPSSPVSPEAELLPSARQTSVVDSKRLFWLRDLLPLDIPDASIHTYGYDADVIGMSSSKSASKMTLTKLGQNMLMDLDRGLPDQVCSSTLVEQQKSGSLLTWTLDTNYHVCA